MSPGLLSHGVVHVRGASCHKGGRACHQGFCHEGVVHATQGLLVTREVEHVTARLQAQLFVLTSLREQLLEYRCRGVAPVSESRSVGVPQSPNGQGRQARI